MNERIVFSIIMPCYNVGLYLREALDSVLSQDFKEWECICVDDGSSDTTPLVLDEYAAKDGRIRVIHQVNGGTGAARNTALKIARGEWLAMLDGDDVWHPNLLRRCYQVVSEHTGLDGVCFGKISGANLKFAPISDESEKEADLSIRIDNMTILGAYVWQHIYRRKLMNKICFRPFVMSEDAIWVAQFLVRAKKECIISDALYGYRMRSGSMVHSEWSYRKWREALLAYREITALYKSSGKIFDSEYVKTVTKFLVYAPLARIRRFNLKLWPKLLTEYLRNIGGISDWVSAPRKYRIVSAFACLFGQEGNI